MHSAGRKGFRVVARAGLACVLALSAWAQAAESPMLALVEWEHPFPAEVSYFRVHFSETQPEATSEGTAIQVGLPGSRGRYSWSFSVEPKKTLWVAVQAMGPTGLGSPLSQWRKYQWKDGGGALGLPGRPVLVQGATTASK